jgi:peptidoglycan/LPS O-acetylase OafA/YrhL
LKCSFASLAELMMVFKPAACAPVLAQCGNFGLADLADLADYLADLEIKMKNSFAAWLRNKLVFPSSGQHWDCLDGLRGMAILMVVACHAFHYTAPNIRFAGWPRLAHAFVGAGHLGVQVFFVLSGFLISQPFFAAKLKNSESWYLEGYAARRALKIIPPAYLIIFVFSIYYCFVEHDFIQLKYGLLWLAGIPDFIPIPDAFGFNPVFWSLWVEVEFYVLLPVLFWVLRKCSYVKTGVAIVLLLLMVPFLTRQLDAKAQIHAIDLFYLAKFPNGLTNFSWGILFACIYSVIPQDGRHRRHLGLIGYVGIAALAITMLLEAEYYILNPIISYEIPVHLSGISTFMALFFVFDPGAFGTRFFSIPFIRYLGLVSYEWFLLHFLILDRYRAWLGGIPYATKNLGHYFFTALIPMMASLLLAMVVYHYFSMPIIKWGRNRLKSKKAL